jgi:hypothetical protein
MEGLEKIFTSDKLKDVTLNYEGTEIKLKVRDLSWSERTKIVGDSFSYSDAGMKFNIDYYNKTVLMKIIVEAPWGATDQIFFTRINASFGSMLEKLVPKAFAEGQDSSIFFAQEPKT